MRARLLLPVSVKARAPGAPQRWTFPELVAYSRPT